MEIVVEHRGTFLRERGAAIVLLLPHGQTVFSDAPSEAERVGPNGRKDMKSARASRSATSSRLPCFGTAETR